MTLEERFWKYVNPCPNTGCFLWGAATMKAGYGEIGVIEHGKLKNRYAHRIAWELARGPIPKGAYVCHTCDVRACVNPDHLFLGTPRDNSRDAVRKGRIARGENHPSAKLTAAQVRDLVSAKGSHAQIAARFGISRRQVSDIRRGKCWAHVDQP